MDFDKVIRKSNEVEETPWWAEYLNINLANWPKERLIRLYKYVHSTAIQITNELYERIDELKNNIYYKDKLITSLEEQLKKERLQTSWLRRSHNEALDQIAELKKKLH